MAGVFGVVVASLIVEASEEAPELQEVIEEATVVDREAGTAAKIG